MIHKASAKFWKHYADLPEAIRDGAKKTYALLKENPHHPGLHFKKLGATPYWSVRINIAYRAVAVEAEGKMVWFWIGPHSTYDKLIKGS